MEISSLLIVALVASTVAAFLSLGLSLIVFMQQRKTQKYSVTKDFNSTWQVFNRELVNNDHFLKMEQDLHPHGEITTDDIRKIYFYFMRFNVSYSAFLGANKNELHKKLSHSALNNEANLSFHDQEFIKKHVFSRGYDRDFAQAFMSRWDKIKKSQRTLPMFGDDSGEFVSSLRAKPQ